MSTLVEHGSDMLRSSLDSDDNHVWHISPIKRITIGSSCMVFPQSLGCISPQSISSRKSLLQQALACERKVESVDQTMAYRSCIGKMDSLLTAILAAEKAECTPQGKGEHNGPHQGATDDLNRGI
jgi:hypothetical protein